jgi:hypothetical protein
MEFYATTASKSAKEIFSGWLSKGRHCEELSDEAIQTFSTALDCFASLAMTEEPARAQATREIRMARGIAKIAAMHNCL